MPNEDHGTVIIITLQTSVSMAKNHAMTTACTSLVQFVFIFKNTIHKTFKTWLSDDCKKFYTNKNYLNCQVNDFNVWNTVVTHKLQINVTL